MLELRTYRGSAVNGFNLVRSPPRDRNSLCLFCLGASEEILFDLVQSMLVNERKEVIAGLRPPAFLLSLCFHKIAKFCAAELWTFRKGRRSRNI